MTSQSKARRTMAFLAVTFLAMTGGAMTHASHVKVGLEIPPATATSGASTRHLSVPNAICVRPKASALEVLAANEIRRYAYLRTGTLLPVKKGSCSGTRVMVSRQDKTFCGETGQRLKPQEFTVRTDTKNGPWVWWIVGGDEVGTLYGAYQFAEKLGVRFGLHEDVLPDGPFIGDWPEMNETGRPRFALRGLQPFHDFSVGPDWWNADDYESVLTQMAKLRMNFIGLHTYPSWNPAAGPEANVWIGLPGDVTAQGDVRFGYEAGVVTTRAGWAVTPYPTNQYASGAGLLFEADDYGPDFMLPCLDWPKSQTAATEMFNRYGDLQQRVFSHARRLGIKTCVGTEVPLGIPPALIARLEDKGLTADDPVVIQRLYEGIFLRLKHKLPVDYYWLWTPEVWLGREPGCKDWEITTRENVARDFGLVEAASKSVGAPFGFATCGWRLGTRDDALWTDKHTPKTWAASSIGTSLGRDPVEKTFGVMTGRPRWVIAWAEDDGTAGAHCCTCWDLQLWVERMFTNSSQACRYGCEGMMAIHWRTAAISPNIEALARAGWDFEATANSASSDSGVDGRTPSSSDKFWANWGTSLFGGPVGSKVGRLIGKFDGCHLELNSLIGGGVRTTDEQIADLFEPLREIESLRPRIQGRGNLDRFDYWLNLIRASELRVRTWVQVGRLAGKMTEVNSLLMPAAKRDFARREILPLRLAVARSYEDMIAAFVNCARSPGEVGTISSIESGSRVRIVSAHDSAIAALLGEPLPASAAISTAYRGPARIFVSAKRTQTRVGEPLEIRAFVLSSAKCTAVTLHWRPLGQGIFQQARANHRARQAFRVTLPTQAPVTVEYYLEAATADGENAVWPVTAPQVNQTVIVTEP